MYSIVYSAEEVKKLQIACGRELSANISTELDIASVRMLTAGRASQFSAPRTDDNRWSEISLDLRRFGEEVAVTFAKDSSGLAVFLQRKPRVELFGLHRSGRGWSIGIPKANRNGGPWLEIEARALYSPEHDIVYDFSFYLCDANNATIPLLYVRRPCTENLDSILLPRLASRSPADFGRSEAAALLDELSDSPTVAAFVGEFINPLKLFENMDQEEKSNE